MTINSKQMASTTGGALFVLGTVAGLAVISASPAKASEAYIQQARGNVAAGATIMTKPTPETAMPANQPAPAAAAPTAPDTCNAQNASSSQACYTATQQARPASK